MPPKKTAEPVLEKTQVTYFAQVKANLGDFENADCGITESELWDVTGLSVELVEALRLDRYEALKESIDERVAQFYIDQSKNAG